MSTPAADALTALANQAAQLADALLADHSPRDWSSCPRAAEILEMARVLERTERMLPSPVVELQRRAEAMLG
jgi:hypothetical protein